MKPLRAIDWGCIKYNCELYSRRSDLLWIT